MANQEGSPQKDKATHTGPFSPFSECGECHEGCKVPFQKAFECDPSKEAATGSGNVGLLRAGVRKEGGPGSGPHSGGGSKDKAEKLQSALNKLKQTQARETLAASRLKQFQDKISQSGDQSMWNSQQYKDLASEYRSAVTARQGAMRAAKSIR